ELEECGRIRHRVQYPARMVEAIGTDRNEMSVDECGRDRRQSDHQRRQRRAQPQQDEFESVGHSATSDWRGVNSANLRSRKFTPNVVVAATALPAMTCKPACPTSAASTMVFTMSPATPSATKATPSIMRSCKRWYRNTKRTE